MGEPPERNGTITTKLSRDHRRHSWPTCGQVEHLVIDPRVGFWAMIWVVEQEATDDAGILSPTPVTKGDEESIDAMGRDRCDEHGKLNFTHGRYLGPLPYALHP